MASCRPPNIDPNSPAPISRSGAIPDAGAHFTVAIPLADIDELRRALEILESVAGTCRHLLDGEGDEQVAKIKIKEVLRAMAVYIRDG